ncbi:zf-HC2 domain-containing protein, partial [Streptomyces sp. BV286]|nr:zf-HC2 domain-containing protein [Streptomyces sp. BV286]
MSDDHDGVPGLLADRALGMLRASDERTVRSHLAGCENCAARAERLRATVRLLDAPPGAAEPAAAQDGPAGPDGVLAVA